MEALGSVTYTVQVFSTSHRCLKAVTLEEPLGAGRARRTHIPRTGDGARSVLLLGSSSQFSRQFRLSCDLLQHLSVNSYYILLFATHCA